MNRRIQLYYRGEKVKGYSMDEQTQQIYNSYNRLAVLQKNNRYVHVRGTYAKVESIIEETIKYNKGEIELVEMPEVDITSKDVKSIEVPEVDMTSSELNAHVAFNEYAAYNLLRAEAMGILEEYSDEVYWEFRDFAIQHIINSDLRYIREEDVMVDLIIANVIEPRNDVKGLKMRDEFEFMTFEEIARELDIFCDSNHSEQLKKYWLQVVRRSFADKIQYCRGHVSISEFGVIKCPTVTIHDVIGTCKLLKFLYKEHKVLY